MKLILIELMAVAIFFCNGAVGATPTGEPFPAPKLVELSADDLFVPASFDDNDEVQVVLHGQLDNTCYKLAPALVQIDREARTIRLTTRAYHYEWEGCLNTRVSFTQTVDIGILQSGSYHLLETRSGPNGQSKTVHSASLRVEPSMTRAADDFMLAPVQTLQVDVVTRSIALTGVTSSECMRMSDTKILNTAPHVLEVFQLVSYRFFDSAKCRGAGLPFEIHALLPQVEAGETLIYVHSLEGGSLSEVVRF